MLVVKKSNDAFIYKKILFIIFISLSILQNKENIASLTQTALNGCCAQVRNFLIYDTKKIGNLKDDDNGILIESYSDAIQLNNGNSTKVVNRNDEFHNLSEYVTAHIEHSFLFSRVVSVFDSHFYLKKRLINLVKVDFYFQRALAEIERAVIYISDSVQGSQSELMLRFAKFSSNIEEITNRVFTEERSGILVRLFTGKKSSEYQSLEPYIAKSGLLHIFAISGFHLSLMYAISQVVLRTILSQKLSRFFAIIPCIFFLLLSGYSVSAVRAMLMLSMSIGASFVKRQYNSVRALIIAAYVLLTASIAIAYSISFQLSFLATLIIIMLLPVIKKDEDSLVAFLELQKIQSISEQSPLPKFTMVYNYIRDSLAISAAITFVMWPLMIYHFGIVELSQLISSTMTSWVLYPLMIFSIIFFFVQAIGIHLVTTYCTKVLEILLDFLLGMVYFFSRVSLSFSLDTLSPLAIFAWLFFCLLLFRSLSGKVKI